MAKTMIQGNLTADPQILKSKDDRKFAKFTVAENHPNGETTYYNCYSNNVNYVEKVSETLLVE